MWLSATGPLGDGTGRSATNAADASTQAKYDALYIGVTNTVFNYLPGLYQTKGWAFQARQSANAGCHHIGSGIDVTTIQLVGASNATGDGVIFGNDQSPGISSDNFSIEFLTLDCNATNQPKWTGALGFVAAIQTVGNHQLFQHLKIINWGSSSSAETFPIALIAGNGFSNQTFNDLVVASCIVTQPVRGNGAGSGCSCIGSSGSQANNNVVNSRFIGNQIIGIRSDFSYSHGIGGPYCSNNVIIDCATAMYIEPSDNQGNFVNIGNLIMNCSQGYAIKFDDTATAGIGTFVFGSNFIGLSPGGGTGFLIDDSGLVTNHPTVATLIIQDNVVYLPPENAPANVLNLNLSSPSGKYAITNCFITRNAWLKSIGNPVVINNPSISYLLNSGNIIYT